MPRDAAAYRDYQRDYKRRVRAVVPRKVRAKQTPAEKKKVVAKWRARQKARIKTDPEYGARVRAQTLKRVHRHNRRSRQGIPEFCEVCGGPPPKDRSFHRDHDHATGAFRGWLCANCNLALGHAKDSPTVLRALIAYLERSGVRVDKTQVVE